MTGLRMWKSWTTNMEVLDYEYGSPLSYMNELMHNINTKD